MSTTVSPPKPSAGRHRGSYATNGPGFQYYANDTVLNPSGLLVVSVSDHVSGSSYTATNWTPATNWATVKALVVGTIAAVSGVFNSTDTLEVWLGKLLTLLSGKADLTGGKVPTGQLPDFYYSATYFSGTGLSTADPITLSATYVASKASSITVADHESRLANVEAKVIHQKGGFANSAALIAAWPTGVLGDNAIVGDQDTIWTWDVEGGAWKSTDNVAVGGTPDAAPTSGSNNSVQSGGVYNALQGKQATLQSGINIKRINGVSLIDNPSVDLTVTATPGPPVDFEVAALQDLGSTVKGITLHAPIRTSTSQFTLTGQQVEGGPMKLVAGTVITSLGVYVKTAGVYVGTGENSLFLVQVGGTGGVTSTRVAVTTNNTELWKTAGELVAPLTTPYTVPVSGTYYVALLYNYSSFTTHPIILASPGFGTTGVLNPGMGSMKTLFKLTGQTASPTSINLTTATANGNNPHILAY